MIKIRPETENDVAAIRSVNEACFPGPGEANLVDALRHGGSLLVSLVAVVDDRVVGHIAFSPVTTDSGDIAVGLAPVAVVEDYRRQGIGAQLVKAGLAAARDAGYGWAVVLGEPSYYQRFGFTVARAFGLADEFGGGAAFQAMELIAGGLPRNAGVVRYRPEFGTVT
jgi:putative acetyltransferase